MEEFQRWGRLSFTFSFVGRWLRFCFAYIIEIVFGPENLVMAILDDEEVA